MHCRESVVSPALWHVTSRFLPYPTAQARQCASWTGVSPMQNCKKGMQSEYHSQGAAFGLPVKDMHVSIVHAPTLQKTLFSMASKYHKLCSQI